MKIAQKVAFLQVFETEATSQTVLPDRPVIIGQKLVENAKIENLKCDILGDFQTLWRSVIDQSWCKKWQGVI